MTKLAKKEALTNEEKLSLNNTLKDNPLFQDVLKEALSIETGVVIPKYFWDHSAENKGKVASDIFCTSCKKIICGICNTKWGDQAAHTSDNFFNVRDEELSKFYRLKYNRKCSRIKWKDDNILAKIWRTSR